MTCPAERRPVAWEVWDMEVSCAGSGAPPAPWVHPAAQTGSVGVRVLDGTAPEATRYAA